MGVTPNQTWNAKQYSENARFVSDLGLPVVDLLAPLRGEDILDLRLGAAAGSLVLELTDPALLFRTAGRQRVGEAVRARRLTFSPRLTEAPFCLVQITL